LLVSMAMDAREMSKLVLTEIGAALTAGGVVGVLNYLTLWWNARLFTSGGSALIAWAVQLARLAMLATALALVARFGTLPLLAAALGVLAVRSIMVLRLGANP
jgi:F1F0 ATPase subunit 2